MKLYANLKKRRYPIGYQHISDIIIHYLKKTPQLLSGIGQRWYRRLETMMYGWE